VQLANSVGTWEAVRELAVALDAQGWHSLWLPDHLLPPPKRGDESQPTYDAWTFLAGLAVSTRRIKLGCLVSANTFRPPALLAKMACTLDAMAPGRVTLGLGAAWFEREHRAFGLDFPGLRERQDRLEEAAASIRALLTEPLPVTRESRYYPLDRAPFNPRGAVSLLIGGGGEKRTLRTAARYADISNVQGILPDIARKMTVLDEHCRAAGRDPRSVRRSLAWVFHLTDDAEEAALKRAEWGPDLSREERLRSLLVGSVDHLRQVASGYEALGIEEIMLQTKSLDTRLYQTLHQGLA
jgi:alkanesulfonate monooxygenase SsuD/methylene tetrahydromethanopterin reductase-like flavin-dependent oxidoreductase (luciferase family)